MRWVFKSTHVWDEKVIYVMHLIVSNFLTAHQHNVGYVVPYAFDSTYYRAMLVQSAVMRQ